MGAETINEREMAMEQLKREAFNISNITLMGTGARLGDIKNELLPGQYNEANGVTVFATNEAVYAVPTSGNLRGLIDAGELQLNESVGVPQLNNADVWGTEEQRRSGDAFKEWSQLSGQK